MNILRPLSPHLPIYKPQLTSTFPISHRISGAFLATIVLFFYLFCLKMGLICFTYENFYQVFFYSSKLILISVEIVEISTYLLLEKGFLLLKDHPFFISFTIFSFVVFLRAKNETKKLPSSASKYDIFGSTLFLLTLCGVWLCLMSSGISHCDGRNAFTPLPSPAQSPHEPAVPQEAPPVPRQLLVPQLENPLLPDLARKREIYDRIIPHFFGRHHQLREVVDLVNTQFKIERHVEAALVADGFDAASILANRHQIRGVIFFRNDGALFSAQTYQRYMTQIERNGTRRSLPYLKLMRARRNWDVFF